MKFLVDECTGPSVAAWLRDDGHEVFSVYEEARGVVDDIILQKYIDRLPNAFVVVTEKQVRFSKR